MDSSVLSFPPALLLLSDSALPLGSFAFSSGLESYLAHHIRSSKSTNTASTAISSPSAQNSITSFLSLSLLSVSSAVVPYLAAAYNKPSGLRTLDNDLDASTTCTVARRASVAQGRALIGVWEKAFKNVEPVAIPRVHVDSSRVRTQAARDVLNAFALSLKTPLTSASVTSRPPPNGHLAPLFALVCLSQSLSLQDTTWIFLFNHARAVLSAAVRAGVMGPYQSQALLASNWLRELLTECTQRGLNTSVEDAGQCVPPMDVWGGRHELLYTRIFNS